MTREKSKLEDRAQEVKSGNLELPGTQLVLSYRTLCELEMPPYPSYLAHVSTEYFKCASEKEEYIFKIFI